MFVLIPAGQWLSDVRRDGAREINKT